MNTTQPQGFARFARKGATEHIEISNYLLTNDVRLQSDSEWSSFAGKIIPKGTVLYKTDHGLRPWFYEGSSALVLSDADIAPIVRWDEIYDLDRRMTGVESLIDCPASGKTGVFRTPYIQYSERNGQSFIALGRIDPDTYDAEDVGVMYRIRFEDGKDITAWPEEVGSFESSNAGRDAESSNG